MGRDPHPEGGRDGNACTDASGRPPGCHEGHGAAGGRGLLLSGCSLLGPEGEAPPPPPTGPEQQTAPREGTLLPQGTTEVEIAAGQSVQVSLPEGSLGVGDYWGVIAVEDPAIAEAEVVIGERVFGVEPDQPGQQAPGGTSQFAVELEGLEAGETTVRVLYCARTKEVSEDCDQSHGTLDPPVDPVEITVRVE